MTNGAKAPHPIPLPAAGGARGSVKAASVAALVMTALAFVSRFVLFLAFLLATQVAAAGSVALVAGAAAPRSVQQAAARPPAPAPADTPALAARERQAKQDMAEGRYDAAARGYRELLERLPNEPGLLMNLGMALAMGGHAQDAIAPLTSATKLRPSLLPAWLFLGNAYLDLGQPEKAIPSLQRFVAAQPEHVESRQLLAAAQLMSGHPREALTHYRRLTKLAPRDAKTWAGIVQCFDALAQDALEHLRQAPNADVYQQLILAEALESEDKNEQAFALYRNALDTLPRFRAIHDALAQIYEKTGHQDWAVAERAKAEAIPLDCAASSAPAARGAPAGRSAPTGRSAPGAGSAPDAAGAGGASGARAARAAGTVSATRNAECEFRAQRYANVVSAAASRTDAESHYWRARAYAELALEAFTHLAELPPSQELHELKAELYRNEGRHLQSVEELKAALTFAPKDPRLRKELAKAYYLSRDTEHARPILEELAAREPDDPEVPLLYGEVLLEAQQTEEALPYLKQAVERDPASIDAHASLGRALVQLGQPAEAIPHLQAALPQDEDGSLRYQLARAYQATGHPDLAKPLLEEYQSLQRAAQARAQAAPADAKITPP